METFTRLQLLKQNAMKSLFLCLAKITNAFPYYCLFTSSHYDIN